MLELKSELLQALGANSTLISLLGGSNIYQMVAPDPTQFPRITFFEMTNIDDRYADDAVWSSEIHMQIDVWHTASTSAIALAVDQTMKSLKYQRTSATDLYEHDTTLDVKIFHKAMRYVTIREEA